MDALVTYVRAGARVFITAVAAITFVAATTVTCKTQHWRPLTVAEWKREVFATVDRKQIVDQSSVAASAPQPEPPPLPAISERIPPATPRKEDEAT